ncbi:MAG: Hsp20/alpha crystallin family protein [Planctomycetales bacterium]|nr:Hsp20/alpha crystallin family protein [Planctomycetales bacterium]
MVRALRPWRDNSVRPWEDFYKEMDGLLGQFFGEDGGKDSTQFVPRVNIAEDAQKYEITADLPGMDPKNVSVEMHDGQLTISGKRESEKKEEGKTYHRVERSYGEFRRVIALPAIVDESHIEANYTDGVLHVSLPKSEKVKPTRIAVRTVGK